MIEFVAGLICVFFPQVFVKKGSASFEHNTKKLKRIGIVLIIVGLLHFGLTLFHRIQ
jgi:uncharacterized protein YjeT (DUF2065 family)